jgi:sugar phosphate permease
MISIAVSKKIVRYKQDENVFINVQENTKKDFNKMLASTGIVFIMVPVMMKCMLDIGVTTWVPTMIAETYTVTPLFSTFLAMFLPMTNLFGTYIAANLNERFIKDEVKTSSLLYSLCLPPLCLLLLIGKINIYVCVAMLAVITTFVTGVTLMLFVLIPTRFAKYGKTSSVAGLLNGVATVGIVISNYGYGYVSQKFGWNATILFWIFIAVVAIVFCMLAFQKWRAFIAEKI